jgi:hypothetical protein
VKEAAFAQGITRDAFYRRVLQFQRRAYRSALARLYRPTGNQSGSLIVCLAFHFVKL